MVALVSADAELMGNRQALVGQAVAHRARRRGSLVFDLFFPSLSCGQGWGTH